ncbi:MAG: hypothetical protein GX887_04085 [Firmicutes bacterium]|nr:hypothetical protein [Bacillota bacterium]
MPSIKDTGNLFLDIQKEKMKMVNLLLAQSLSFLDQARMILNSVNDDLNLPEKPRDLSPKEIYTLDDLRKR